MPRGNELMNSIQSRVSSSGLAPTAIHNPTTTTAYNASVIPSSPSSWNQQITRPAFNLEAPSLPYQPTTTADEINARSTLPAPVRALPSSHAHDQPASTLGGHLNSLATTGDMPLTGIPRLIEHMTAPIGAISNVTGKVLNMLGLQKALASATVALIDNPITDGIMQTGARLSGMALGLTSPLLGEKTLSDITSNALNFISSERGGATLAAPALQSMNMNQGWQGALDGLVHENAGLNWYSTFFLGNMKNQTGGGEGQEFYKQLVVDTWDQAPAGREFLASVGRSAVSREPAARWYSEYYYDVLDEENGSGIATKVVDTLDYRFGLDAGNMNAIYQDGAQRGAAFARAHPQIAADLSGNSGHFIAPPHPSQTRHSSSTASSASTTPPSTQATPQTTSYTPTSGTMSPITQGGLSTANSAVPTGPELSRSTSHTRAYRNNDASSSLLAQPVQGLVGSAISLLAGPLTAIGGGLLGKAGMGQVMATTFDKIFSGDGGKIGQAFMEGAVSMPSGQTAVNGLLKGTLSSSAGTAWTITALQQFSKDQDGVEFFHQFLKPILTKRADGTSILDDLLMDAQHDPVLANNLRAIADETSESLSAQNLLKTIGAADFVSNIRKALPIASRYAYLETGANSSLPLSHPDRLKALFANNLVGEQKLFDTAGQLTDFAKIGLRMFGHDLLDGRIDGDVALRTLLNPVGSDNTDFRRNIELVKKWGEMDLNDDNTINGSVYRALVEQCLVRTGASEVVSLQGLPLSVASSDDSVWRTDVPSMFDFANFKVNIESYQKLAKNYHLTPIELTDLVLWGHLVSRLPADAQERQKAFDTQIKNALAGAPSATFEHIFVRDVPGVREHFQQLMGDFDAFNQSVVHSLKKLITSQL